MKKLNVNQLKYLAAFFMVLDNAYLAMPMLLPSWIHLITRFVAPLFAFFLVEGFFHTRNRSKYVTRLWLAAALMQGGDYISFLLLGQCNQISDNIFLTLALGFTIIYLFECGKQHAIIKRVIFYVLGILLTLIGFAGSFIPVTIGQYYFGLEGGIQILSVVIIFYLFYGNRTKQVIVFLLWNTLLICLSGVPMPGQYPSLTMWFEDFCYNCESYTFLFLPFLLLYNGEKGHKTNFNRNFFYVFYPAHLWILHLIAVSL